MSAEPLLLSESRSGVPVQTPQSLRWRWVAIAIGVTAIAVGAADLASRFSQSVLGDSAPCITFGPAISALDPSLADNCNP